MSPKEPRHLATALWLQSGGYKTPLKSHLTTALLSVLSFAPPYTLVVSFFSRADHKGE